MRKKILVLGSLLLLISSYFLINQLQESSFTVFNTISADKIEDVRNTLKEKEDLTFTALLCNEIRVPFDDLTNTFFVPLNMEDESWEKLEFASGQPEFGILFSEDVTSYAKKDVIAEGKKFDLIVFDQGNWSNYHVVFSGLPIIDLTTNEGFYAEEGITGNITFFDTDFSLHGITQSEYNGHIRGNTSRMFPKKGYKINLTCENEAGETVPNKLQVFGMRKDDDWMLHALYNDDTKLRDMLSIEVWDRIGANAVSEKSYYGPRMSYVEVIADNGYCGVYGLMEPVDGKQLDLADEDYSYKRKNSGGIRYKHDDFTEATDPYAVIEGFEIKDGVMDEDAWEAMAWISALLTLKDEERMELESQDIINEDSAIRMWVFLQMITGHDHTAKNVFYVAHYNYDYAYNYQFYFAPWDMDLTWGNVSVGEVNPYYTDFEMETYDDRVYWETADWIIDINYHGGLDKARALYKQLRQTTLTDEEIQNIISGLDGQLRGSGAFARDKERWPDGIHAEDTSALREYAKKRLNFLDRAIDDFNYFQE